MDIDEKYGYKLFFGLKINLNKIQIENENSNKYKGSKMHDNPFVDMLTNSIHSMHLTGFSSSIKVFLQRHQDLMFIKRIRQKITTRLIVLTGNGQ